MKFEKIIPRSLDIQPLRHEDRGGFDYATMALYDDCGRREVGMSVYAKDHSELELPLQVARVIIEPIESIKQ